MRIFLFAGVAVMSFTPWAWAQNRDTRASNDDTQPAPSPAPSRPAAGASGARFTPGVDDELILRVVVNGEVVADGMSGELWSGGVRLPLSQLAAALEFPITVEPRAATATGWFIDQRRSFAFDGHTRTGQSNGQSISPPDGAINVTDDDIYVDTAELASWFPLEFTNSLDALEIEIKPKEALPMQRRHDRESLRQRLVFGRLGPEEPPPLRAPLPYSFFSSPYFGVRQSWGASEVSGDDYQYDVRASADIAWMTGRVFLSGQGKEGLQGARVGLGREDPYGTLPGGLTQFELGDTFVPTAPLISRSVGGRGISFSNAPLTRTEDFDHTILRGELPAGSDVELYRNGVLIGSQGSRGDGLYEFDDVPLEFGDNELRLVFYGPSGETRQEVRNARVGDDFLRPGQVQFQFGAVQQGAPIIDPNERLSPRPGDGDYRVLGRADVGISQRMSLSASLATMPITDAHRVSTAGLTARFGMSRFAFHTDAAYSSDNAWSYGAGVSGKVFGASFGLDDIEFQDGFESDLTVDQGDNVRRISDMRAATILDLGPLHLPIDFDAQRIERTNGNLEDDAALRFTLPLPGRLLFSHTLTYQRFDDDRTVYGDIDLNASFGRWLARGSYEYDVEHDFTGRAASIQATRDFGELASIRAAWNYDFDRGSNVTTQYIRHFDQADISFGVTYDEPRDDTSALVTLSFGFGRDGGQNGRWIMSHNELSDGGMSRARVFLDNDLNGRFSAGDEPLRGVKVGVNSGLSAETDATGDAFLTGLQPDQPAVVALDPASLPDPYMLPAGQRQEIVPRPGRLQRLEFPVVQTGGLEGVTTFTDATGAHHPVGNVHLDLVDSAGHAIASVTSEYDGFFSFDRVRPGDYQVRLSEDRARELNVAADNSRIIHIAADGSVVRGVDMQLHRSGDLLMASAQMPSPGTAQPPPPAVHLTPPPAPTAQLASTMLPSAAMPPTPVESAPALASVSGKLIYEMDSGPFGLEGVTVRLTDASHRTARVVQTQKDGSFDISGLQAGRYAVTADRLGLASRSLIADAVEFEIAVSDQSKQIAPIRAHEMFDTPQSASTVSDNIPEYRPPPAVQVANLSPPTQATTPVARAATQTVLVEAAPPHELWAPTQPIAPATQVAAGNSPLTQNATQSSLWAPDSDASLAVRLIYVNNSAPVALANFQLDILDQHGAVVATSSTDDAGGFTSPKLPRGVYYIVGDARAMASRGVRVEPLNPIEIGPDSGKTIQIAVVARPSAP